MRWLLLPAWLRLPLAVLVAAPLLFSACGEEAPRSRSDTLAAERPTLADPTGDIRNQPLTPSTLRDPRMETLSRTERRLLQDYVSRGVRRDSLEAPASRRSLGGWLDSNLTVGEVIALYRGAAEVEPLPPQPLSPSPGGPPEPQPGDGWQR